MPKFPYQIWQNIFLTDPDLKFWIRVVSRSGSGSGSAGSVAALSSTDITLQAIRYKLHNVMCRYLIANLTTDLTKPQYL